MTVEEFIQQNGAFIDQVAEANDNLGTCQGVVLDKDHADVVELVFEHGIVDIWMNNLRILAIRRMVRFDGS